MNKEQDLLSTYGEKVQQKPTPIEPMTAEELKLLNISTARREEYDYLMATCAVDCKHCGKVYKEPDYDSYRYIEIPFICDIDAADRVCQGVCSKYKKYYKVAFVSNRRRRPEHTLKDYDRAYSSSSYGSPLRTFANNKIRRP